MDADEQMRFADKMARKWSMSLLNLAGCEVNVLGGEKIPDDRAVLYVCNHQSNFDIPLMIAYMPKTKGFMAKIETLKLPMVRSWMKHMRCVFMDRSDMRKQVKSISEGIKILKDGQSLVLFPEGTRSPDGELGEFKAGGLKLATKSGATIVPVTINHSKEIMKKGSLLIRPAKVTLTVNDPIEITDEMNRDTITLTESIKSIIESALER